MKRRDSGAALAWPLGASAQQAAKVPRIGYLTGNLAANPDLRVAFLQGLRVVRASTAEQIEEWHRAWLAKNERLRADRAARCCLVLVGANTRTEASGGEPLLLALCARCPGRSVVARVTP